jgi:SagB-type dehydrogenase family enzyme
VPRPSGLATIEYRRSPHLAFYWRDAQPILVNYATGMRTPGPLLARELLDFCEDWRSEDAIAETMPGVDRGELQALLALMVDRGLLTRSDRPVSDADKAMAAWRAWNPSAGLFHTATKDVPFATLDEMRPALRKRSSTRPMPDPIKRYPDAPSVALPPAAKSGEFADVLLGRRTWRTFGRAPIALADLATMLDLTAGVQRWVTAAGEGRVAFKTSPSGGARHAIELYVLARNVRGLARGFYHYAPDTHRLERVAEGATPAQIERYLPTQDWYRGAGAVVFFAPVFARTLWRYEYARAYRAVLIEAGHLCQTFCLTATWLGLAPFCTMALADSKIDADLGLDGISESAIYCAGVGTRPSAVDPATPGALPNPEAKSKPKSRQKSASASKAKRVSASAPKRASARQRTPSSTSVVS